MFRGILRFPSIRSKTISGVSRQTEDLPSNIDDPTDPNAGSDIIEIPREVTPRAEYRDFDDPERRARDLKNQDLEGDISEKRRFAKHAYFLAWTWLAFLIVVTFLQATPDWFDFQLDEWAFRILFTSVTAAVFGFAYLVGKYLFPASGMNRN